MGLRFLQVLQRGPSVVPIGRCSFADGAAGESVSETRPTLSCPPSSCQGTDLGSGPLYGLMVSWRCADASYSAGVSNIS